jgi:hypothetical protein
LSVHFHLVTAISLAISEKHRVSEELRVSMPPRGLVFCKIVPSFAFIAAHLAARSEILLRRNTTASSMKTTPSTAQIQSRLAEYENPESAHIFQSPSSAAPSHFLRVDQIELRLF